MRALPLVSVGLAGVIALAGCGSTRTVTRTVTVQAPTRTNLPADIRTYRSFCVKLRSLATAQPNMSKAARVTLAKDKDEFGATCAALSVRLNNAAGAMPTAKTAPVVTATTAAPEPKTQTLTGTGSQNMGTVTVPAQSTLYWSCPTCGSDNFQIFNSATDSWNVGVNGLDQTSGHTVLDAGTYHDFQINTEGQQWTIRIVPN